MHGIGIGFRSEYTTGKGGYKANTSYKSKNNLQVKPRINQGRAGLRCKIKTQVSKPIVQTTE